MWSQPGEEYVYFFGTESWLTYIYYDQLMMGAEKLYTDTDGHTKI